MRKHRLVTGRIIIANATQLLQMWKKHRPNPLPDGWQVWWMSAQHGLHSSKQAPDIPPTPLQSSQVVDLAQRVAKQWNAGVAASVVMVGGWNYQEVAIRADLNVEQRIDGRHMRRDLANFARQISAA